MFIILLTGNRVGDIKNRLGDLAQTNKSIIDIFKIIDSEDEDLLQIKQGSKLIKNLIKGQIEFKDVWFKYETRNEYSLKGVNFKIK